MFKVDGLAAGKRQDRKLRLGPLAVPLKQPCAAQEQQRADALTVLALVGMAAIFIGVLGIVGGLLLMAVWLNWKVLA